MDRQVLHRLVNLVVESVWKKLQETGVVESSQQYNSFKNLDVGGPQPVKKLYTEKDISSLAAQGIQQLVITAKTILTPSARDLCRDHNIIIIIKPLFDDSPSDRQSGYFLLAPTATKTAIDRVAKTFQDQGLTVDLLSGHSLDRIEQLSGYAAEQLNSGKYSHGVILDDRIYPMKRGLSMSSKINPAIEKAGATHNVLLLDHRRLGFSALANRVRDWLLTHSDES